MLLVLLNVKAQEEVRAYNKFTNKAELSIVDSNYTKALKYYNKAFEKIEHPFARDYYNALLCATFTGNNDLAFDYLEKLIYKGIEIEYFTDNEYLESLHKDSRWQVFIDTYPARMEKIQESFNLELRQELIGMIERDQQANRRIIIDTINNYTAFDSTIFANVKHFLEIVEIHGFPTEEMIGLNKPYKSTFNTVILTHYYQTLVSKDAVVLDPYNLNKTLEKAVIEGKLIDDSFFVLMHTYPKKPNIFGSYAVIQIDNKIIPLKYDKKSVNIINRNRKRLGTESFSDSKKKAIFGAEKIKNIPNRKENESAMDYTFVMNDAFKNKYFYIGIDYTATIFYSTKAKSETAYEKKKDIIYHLEIENE